jgi:hypothetical protein
MVKEVSKLTHTIITGPHPAHAGSCKAQHYQNSTPFHTSVPYPAHHHQMVPSTQQPMIGQNQYGIPSWSPTGASFPYLY